MNLAELRLIPTITLTRYIEVCDNQAWKNLAIFELATRIYVPFNGEVSFDDLLMKLGYVDMRKQENNIIL